MEHNLILKEIKKYINFIFIIFMTCAVVFLLSLLCVGLPLSIYLYTQNSIYTTIVSIFSFSTTLYIIINYISPLIPEPPEELRPRPSFYGRSPPVGSNPSSPPPPKK